MCGFRLAAGGVGRAFPLITRGDHCYLGKMSLFVMVASRCPQNKFAQFCISPSGLRPSGGLHSRTYLRDLHVNQLGRALPWGQLVQRNTPKLFGNRDSRDIRVDDSSTSSPTGARTNCVTEVGSDGLLNGPQRPVSGRFKGGSMTHHNES